MDKRAVEKYVDILTPVMASFPMRPPTVASIQKAMRRVATHFAVKWDSAEKCEEWAHAEAKALRSMLAYVRRMVLQNGRNARPGCLWRFSLSSHVFLCSAMQYPR